MKHLEDLMLDGMDGTNLAMETLHTVVATMRDATWRGDISMKWDGAPAIVFGPDPADGRFFVSTKSVFNKTPIIAKSYTEIDDKFNVAIRPALRAAFQHLQTLNPGVIIQAELLFTSDTLSTKLVGEDIHLRFRPNTITYSVPSRSPVGEQVSRAKIGIVPHTILIADGNTLRPIPMGISFHSLRQTPDVFCLDSDLHTIPTFDSEDDFAWVMERAATTAVSPVVYAAVAGPLRTFLLRYINHNVRNNVFITPKELVDNLLIFLDGRKELEMEKRSTPAGKNGVRQRFATMIGDIVALRNDFEAWFRVHNALAVAKVLVIRSLEHTPCPFSMFLDTKPTGPEGFVVILPGHAPVKLVDRLEFSRANLTLPRAF